MFSFSLKLRGCDCLYWIKRFLLQQVLSWYKSSDFLQPPPPLSPLLLQNWYTVDKIGILKIVSFYFPVYVWGGGHSDKLKTFVRSWSSKVSNVSHVALFSPAQSVESEMYLDFWSFVKSSWTIFKRNAIYYFTNFKTRFNKYRILCKLN